MPYNRLTDVVRELPRRLPADARFGFNHDGKGRAWIVVGQEYEAEALALVGDVLEGGRQLVDSP